MKDTTKEEQKSTYEKINIKEDKRFLHLFRHMQSHSKIKDYNHTNNNREHLTTVK